MPTTLPTLPVLRGTLDLLVLRALVRGAMHGFEVVSWLRDSAHDTLDFLDSAMYQSLYRLEERRLISATWGVTENSRRARYYQITTKGRAHLKQETASWLRYTATVSAILTDPVPA